jgi:SAM-dependent methyltransferase
MLRAVESVYYQAFDLPVPTLDLGCGDGQFTFLTFERQMDVGLDPWSGHLHEAARRHCYRLLVQADGVKSPFTEGFFASAFSNSVLEHIPQIDAVLLETSRVLKRGAPFYFCVPNQRYLSELSISHVLGKRYTDWFRSVSRVSHVDNVDIWQERLGRAGFSLEKWWHYFSPSAMRILEWGHFFGLPALIVKKLTGRWIIVPAKWNLWLIERNIRKYVSPEPDEDGVFTFYVSRKM